MICSGCGYESLGNSKYCVECGNLLSFESQSNDKQNNQGRMNQFQATNSNKSTFSMEFKRAKKGAVVFGICQGLANTGRGSVTVWRISLILVSLFLTGVPVIVYLIAGLILPVEDISNQSVNTSKKPSNFNIVNNLEEELVRLKDLKDKNLITVDEFERLRRKALDNT